MLYFWSRVIYISVNTQLLWVRIVGTSSIAIGLSDFLQFNDNQKTLGVFLLWVFFSVFYILGRFWVFWDNVVRDGDYLRLSLSGTYSCRVCQRDLETPSANVIGFTSWTRVRHVDYKRTVNCHENQYKHVVKQYLN